MQSRKTVSILTLISALSLPILAQADLSATAVLDSVYGKHNKRQNCWLTKDENDQGYCMKIDRIDRRNTVTGSRLYILVTGEGVDEKGEPDIIPAPIGLVGAFVVEEHNGKADIIASDPKIPMGESGIPPTNWKLSLIGPSDYWGWQNTTRTGSWDIFGTWYVILAPYGHKIRDLADIIGRYENMTTFCQNDNCKRTDTLIESTLAIDTSKHSEKVYPLRITVTGTLKGKKLKPKTWTLPFNAKSWTYKEPTDWPLRYAEF